MSDRFAHGTWFVDLVSVTDATTIASAIAAALGLVLSIPAAPVLV